MVAVALLDIGEVGGGEVGGGELWAVEIKLTASPAAGDMDRLRKTAEMFGASRCFLVSRTPRPTEGEHQASCNLESWLQRLPR